MKNSAFYLNTETNQWFRIDNDQPATEEEVGEWIRQEQGVPDLSILDERLE